MNSFTVTTLVTKKDYTAFLFAALYKKPVTIIASLIGLYMLLMAALPSLFGNSDSLIFNLGFGLFLVLHPFIIASLLSRQFNANPEMRHEILYTFSEDSVVVKTLTCDSTVQWTHFIKLRETKKFLLLQHTKKAANIVDKTKLTQEQIQFIKSKIGKK
jgi:hypothetical protein